MSYSLSITRALVNEGSSLTIVLDTPGEGLPDGTLVPFSITGTGVTTGDFVGVTSLSGNFNIQSNKGRLTLNPAQDLVTEGSETILLTLTGPGRSESIGFTILDTSVNPVNTPEFYITTSPSNVVDEGTYLTFFANAYYLSAGVVVPYTISGISSDDVISQTLTGDLTFYTPLGGPAGMTSANLTIGITEDFITEGFETIIFLVNPSFPYTVQLTSTVTILDTSVSKIPRYVITPNKTKVVEGGNVVFNMATTNIDDGTIIEYRIIPAGTARLTASDFNMTFPINPDGEYVLAGKFSTVYSNVANVTIYTRDDFIFEQSEFFYLDIVFATSPQVEIIDSGNTYLTSAAVYTGNVNVSFLEKANLQANIAGLIIQESYFSGDIGKISDAMLVQGKSAFAPEDAAVLYQPFSYVLQSSKSIDEWKNSIKSMLHPAGFSIFSEINNETNPNYVKSVSAVTPGNTIISTFSTIDATLNWTADYISIDPGTVSVNGTLVSEWSQTAVTVNMPPLSYPIWIN
jgi:hypothetical protein